MSQKNKILIPVLVSALKTLREDSDTYITLEKQAPKETG